MHLLPVSPKRQGIQFSGIQFRFAQDSLGVNLTPYYKHYPDDNAWKKDSIRLEYGEEQPGASGTIHSDYHHSYSARGSALARDLSPEHLVSMAKERFGEIVETVRSKMEDLSLEVLGIPKGHNGMRTDDENMDNILMHQGTDGALEKLLLRRFLAEDLVKADSTVRQGLQTALKGFNRLPRPIKAQMQAALRNLAGCFVSLHPDGGLSLSFHTPESQRGSATGNEVRFHVE